MTYNGKAVDFLFKEYKGKSLYPAVFEINDNIIEFTDYKTNSKLTIPNSGFTESSRGFNRLKNKWIIKNTIEEGDIIMCIELNPGRKISEIIYYYSFPINDAPTIFDQLNIIRYNFGIDISKHKVVDDSKITEQEKADFNKLEQEAEDPKTERKEKEQKNKMPEN